MLRSSLLFLLWSLTACVVDLRVPAGVAINCDTNSECPEDFRCATEVARCVPALSDDVTAPNAILAENAEALRGGLGSTFTLTVILNEVLLTSPVVQIDFGQGPIACELISTSEDGLILRFIYVNDAADGGGNGTISVRLIDLAGNAETRVLGTLFVDTAAPSINPALLVLRSNPPGVPDLLSGLPGSVEGGSVIDIYLDAGLTTRIGRTLADADGSIPLTVIGDNYTNADGQSGVGQLFVLATDAFGNRSEALTVETDITPPIATDVVFESEHTDPVSGAQQWIQTTTLSLLPARVGFSTASGLASAPLFHLSGRPVTSSCDFDVAAARYTCRISLLADDPPSAPLVATLEESGARNVAVLQLGEVVLDIAAAAAPAAQIVMEPVGTSDRLEIEAGGAEPGATIVLFTRRVDQIMNGSVCVIENRAVTTADASGAASLDLGDNLVSSIRVRQIDTAGNDPCTSCDACDGWIALGNDTVAPSVSFLASPAPLTRGTARFLLDVREQRGSAAMVHPPITTHCALDAGAFAPCASSPTFLGLPFGAHTLHVQVADALGNSATTHADFSIAPTAAVLMTQAAYAPPSDKAYVKTSDGRGHFFVGGNALHHFYDDGSGGFASEVVDPEPAVEVVAGASGTTMHLAWARVDPNALLSRAQILHARGSTASWTQSEIAATRFSERGFDLDLDPSGAPVIVFTRSNSDGDDASSLAITRDLGSGFTIPALLEGAAGIMEPRLVARGTNDLLMSYWPKVSPQYTFVAFDGSSFSAPTLLFGPGMANLSSNPQRTRPALFALSDGTVALRYRPDINATTRIATGVVGNAFAFQSLSLSGASTWASALDPSDNLFSAQPRGNLYRRDSAGVYTAGTLSEVASAEESSLVVPRAGTLASARLELAYLAGTPNERSQVPTRTVRDGGDTLERMGARSSIARVTPLIGEADSVISVSCGGAVTRSHWNGSAWSTAAFITALAGEEILDAAAFAAIDGKRWFAATVISPGVQQPLLKVYYDDTINGWVSVNLSAVVTTNAVRGVRFVAGPSSEPLLAYEEVSGTSTLTLLRWDGSDFDARTTVFSTTPNNLTGFDLIGDHNGGAPGGETWFVAGEIALQQVSYVRVDLATETLTTSACESCVAATVVSSVSYPLVAAAYKPGVGPAILVAAPYARLSLFVFSGGFSETSVPYDLRIPGPSSYVAPAVSPCTLSGLTFLSQPQLTFSAGGRLRAGLMSGCGTRNDIVWMRENDTGAVESFAVGDHGNAGPRETIAIEGGASLFVWNDSRSEVVWALPASALP